MKVPSELGNTSRWNSPSSLNKLELVAFTITYLLLILAVTYLLYYPVLQT